METCQHTHWQEQHLDYCVDYATCDLICTILIKLSRLWHDWQRHYYSNSRNL